MNNIQDLLRLYLDTSIILDNCEKSHADEPLSSGLMSEIESIRRRKANLEKQIIELCTKVEEENKMLEKENGARRILTKTLADFTLAHSGLLYVWLCVQAVFDPAFDFHAEFQGITGQCRKEVR
jgi:hypothetical protein